MCLTSLSEVISLILLLLLLLLLLLFNYYYFYYYYYYFYYYYYHFYYHKLFYYHGYNLLQKGLRHQLIIWPKLFISHCGIQAALAH